MSFRRILINGWKKCVHEAAAFEGKGEYASALILDSSQPIEWWLRNDPARLKIATPAGGFEPDFLYRVRRASGSKIGILEIKGEIFWDGHGSEPRIKAAAACEWIGAVNLSSPDEQWEFALVLEQDAIRANSLDQLLGWAIVRA